MSPLDLFSLGDDSGDDVGDIIGAFFNSGDDSGDIMGDDSGDDAGDLIGALAGALRRAKGRGPARKPVPRGYNPRVVKYEPTKYETLRHIVIGLTATAPVGAGSLANITAQPQVPFQPTKLIVPSSQAPNFLLVDLKIGNQSQFAAGGAVPALAFSETATNVLMKLDMASVAQTIQLTVQNTSGATAPFSAVLFGDAMIR